MDITDNMLSAFYAGESTIDEDRLILDNMIADEEFSDMMDIMSEMDSMDEIMEMRNEFNESVDNTDEYKDYNINIK